MRTFEEFYHDYYEKHRKGRLKGGLLESLGGYPIPEELARKLEKAVRKERILTCEKTLKIPMKGKNQMPVFEVCVVEMPSKNDADDGELEKLILGPVAVVAKDKESAGAIVVMEHNDKLVGVKKSRMKLYTRPFV